MICPNCSTENPDGARFCMACGMSLETPCPNCGTELPAGAKFCFNCGHEIEAGSTTGESGKSARQVTDEIADAVTRLGETSGERRTITMLFCDVTGSTAMAEQLDPEAWSSVMREAFDVFIAPVERYGGTVARLLGDAILAYFGAPTAHEDDPERAVLAALDILEASNALALQVHDEHGVDFGVRIGINTGLVVVGDVGSDLYGEYAALGDAANVAARMEHTAEPDTIRVAEATHRLVEPVFDFESVGKIELKGKTDPIAAYRVIGTKKKRGSQRGIEGLESPMVGRDAEWASALGAVGDLLSGRGRIVSIMGEAGLGKSRLAAELRSDVGNDVRWLEGRSFSYDVATPYGPFVEVLTRCFDLADVPATDRYARIRDRVSELLGSDAGHHAVYLAALLGVEVTGDDASLLEYLEAPVLRQRTFAAIASYLSGLASDRPTVLMLEDLHWADPTSIELTQALLPVTDDVPLLLLFPFRPRRSEPSWQIHETAARDFPHRYVAIELQPLDTASSNELVANLLKVEGLTGSVRSLILEKAEGNPFFVEEVIRSLLDAGVIVPEGERYIATADIDTFAVPDTLAAVLATRLDGLPPKARKVVQAAAVIGREFSFEMLEALTDVGVDLEQVMRDLLQRELVIDQPGSAGRQYLFKHTLTRDTAYETLLQGVRADLHRVVGKLIDEADPTRVTELAYHFSQAGEPRLAFPYLVAAGDVELHAFAAQPAVVHYRRALDSFGEGDDVKIAARAYEGLAQALIFGGDIEGALEAYDDMLAFGERVDSAPFQVSALNKKALANTAITGDLVSAEADLLRAREIGEAAGDHAGIAEFHTVYCALNTQQGHLDTAEEHLREAADLGSEIDSTFIRNFGLTHHASTLMLMGRYDDAELAVADALPIIEASGDRLHTASLIGETRAFLRTRRGEVAEGLEDATWGAGELNDIGAIFTEPIPTFVAATIAMRLGRYEDALALWGRVREIGEMFGQTAFIVLAAAGLSAVRNAIFGPDDEEATRLATLARSEVVTPRGQIFGHLSLVLLASRALEYDRFDEAGDYLNATEGLQSPSEATARPELLLSSAGVAMGEDDLERAVELIAEAEELIMGSGVAFAEPRLAQTNGILQLRRDDRDAAQASFDRAVEGATRMRLLPDLLSAQRRAVSMYAGADMPEAERFRDGAADTVAEIASLFEDPNLRKAFLRANAVR